MSRTMKPSWALTIFDRNAKLAGIDRRTRDGFMFYMAENPIYFQYVFPDRTLDEAWREVEAVRADDRQYQGRSEKVVATQGKGGRIKPQWENRSK